VIVRVVADVVFEVDVLAPALALIAGSDNRLSPSVVADQAERSSGSVEPSEHQELADLRRVPGVLGRVKAPRYFTVGNDCVTTLTKQQFLNVWGAERSWYSILLKGYRLIFLYSAFTSDGKPYGGRW